MIFFLSLVTLVQELKAQLQFVMVESSSRSRAHGLAVGADCSATNVELLIVGVIPKVLEVLEGWTRNESPVVSL